AYEHLEQVLDVLLRLVDARERARRDEHRRRIGARRRQDAGERRPRALRIASAKKELAHLGGDLRTHRGVLRDGRDAREGARHLERPFDLASEARVAMADVVVRGIDPERLLEGLEGALLVVELVLL